MWPEMLYTDDNDVNTNDDTGANASNNKNMASLH